MAPPTPWLDQLTIGQVFADVSRRFPDREAAVFCETGTRWTYQELSTAVRDVARGLLAIGIRPGEHIGLWSTNLPQWILLQYAAASVGVVLVTINPAYRSAELRYTLEQSDVVALFLIDRFKTSDYYSLLAEACPDLGAARAGGTLVAGIPRLRRIVALKSGAPPLMDSWQGLIEAGRTVPADEIDAIAKSLKPTDAINMQYTSGTTGSAKAAMLTHRNILMNAWYSSACQEMTERDRVCIPVPFYHCFGCVLGSLACVTRGATMVIPAESFNAAATLEAVECERCSALYGVPTMFVAMLNDPGFARRDLSSLRTGIMAGAPCPVELMKRVVDDMGCRDITIAYGQTETSPVITQTRVSDSFETRVETIGRELPGIECRIVSPEAGTTLADGQQGELCARGHCVMLGYYQQPEATARTIDRDHWVHTGDLGVRRPDGCFQITGRLKDLVIRGGENIYPREVEDHLFTHPAVMQAAVFGIPDPKYGEELCAWVQLHAGRETTADSLQAHCREGLAHYKVPRHIRFVSEFPTTVSGKIQKFRMREMMAAELGMPPNT